MAYEPGKADARPDLAVAAPTVSADGKTVTVKLRAGVHFSPPVKREVVADDLKYAIERGFFKTVNNPYAPAYFGDLVGAQPGAKRRHEDLRHHDAGRAHRRLQAAAARPAGRSPPRSCCRWPRRCRATTRRRWTAEGLRLRDQAGRDRPVHGRHLQAGHQDHARPQPVVGHVDRLPPRLPRPDRDAAGQRRRRRSRRAGCSPARSMVTGDFLLPPAVLKEAATKRADQLTVVDSGGGRWAALNTTVAPFDNVNVRKAVARRLQPRGRHARARRQARRHRRHALPAAGHARASSRPAASPAPAPTSSPRRRATPRSPPRYMKQAGYAVRPLRRPGDHDGRPGRRQRPAGLRARQGRVRVGRLQGQAAPALPAGRHDPLLRLPEGRRRGLPERRLDA